MTSKSERALRDAVKELASHWEATAADLYAASEKERDPEAAKTQRIMKAVYRQLASDLRTMLSEAEP